MWTSYLRKTVVEAMSEASYERAAIWPTDFAVDGDGVGEQIESALIALRWK